MSSSPLLRRKIEATLSPAGWSVRSFSAPADLLASRRQRPSLVCFLDARGPEGPRRAEECFRNRPGERYVLIRGTWENGADAFAEQSALFGFLREPFGPAEVGLWCTRARTEAQLLQGDRALDDLLYQKFRAFLQSLGPAPMTRFHDLVWERVERPMLTAVLEWTGGNQSRAATILGIHRNTLRAKMRALGIEPGRSA